MRSGEIIGVMADFNFLDLHQEIMPLVIGINNSWAAYMAVKVGPGEVFRTMQSLETVWKKFEP